jgi:hypothetical protein
LIIYVQELWGRVFVLLPETQQQIVKSIYRASADVGRLLGRDDFTYARAIRLARRVFRPDGRFPVAKLVQVRAVDRALPPGAITPEIVKGFSGTLLALDTGEKLEASLLQSPEPTPKQLKQLLSMCDEALPRFAETLIAQLKLFPHRRGGRPRDDFSVETRREIKAEVSALRGPNSKLADLFKQVAAGHEDMTASQVKTIWYSEDIEDKIEGE